MTTTSQPIEKDQIPHHRDRVTGDNLAAPTAESEKNLSEKILCPHCKRTAVNGIKCQGICVADSDY